MCRFGKAIEILYESRTSNRAPLGDLPDDCQLSSVDDAMALQSLVNAQLAQQPEFGSVAGTKIGCTTSVMQQYLGMEHPCSGAVFAETIQYQDGRINFTDYQHVGVECEIAVTLKRDLGFGIPVPDLGSMANVVESVHAAIEVVDDRYVDFQNRIPNWQTWVADNFFGAGLVLGPPVYDWQHLDLAKVRGEMWINGKSAGSGQGSGIIDGHPLQALRWLARQKSALGQVLPAGHVVTLGSVVQTHWLKASDVVNVRLEHLGEARLHT